MRRRDSLRLICFLTISLLLTPVVVPVASVDMASNSMPNIIFISWDGVNRDRLRLLMDEGKLPATSALARMGSYRNVTIISHNATQTIPGHAVMLTGIPAPDMGIYTNGNYTPVPDGLTLWERLESLSGMDWWIAGAVTKGLLYEYWMNDTDKPGVFFNAVPDTDLWIDDEIPKQKHFEDVNLLGKGMVNLIMENVSEPFFIFAHFGAPDHISHRRGEGSEQLIRSLILCDYWLGRAMAALAQKSYRNTLIYITTDHGFNWEGHDHNAAPDIWLVTNDGLLDKSIQYQQDITPAILTRLNLTSAYPESLAVEEQYEKVLVQNFIPHIHLGMNLANISRFILKEATLS